VQGRTAEGRKQVSNVPEQIGPEQRAEELRKAGEAMAREDLVRWHSELGQTFIQADEEPKPVEWMVDGLMTFDGITLYTAKSKLGKSSLTYDLAIAGASGTGSIRTPDGGWLFDFKGKAVKTYYLDTENSRSLVIRRLESLAKEKGGTSRKDLLSSGQLVVNCLEVQSAPPFLALKRETIEDDVERAREWGELLGRAGFRFIILDVLSHCYPEDEQGRDENDRAFIANFFKVANAIRTGANACLLLVHHHRKGPADQGNESASGSGQLLRTPTTLISVSKLPESKNPDGDLHEILIEGRETKGARKILKARGTADGVCRAFDQVDEPVKEKKARGAPSTATGLALELLKAVLLKEPEKQGAVISPAEWLKAVKRVNLAVPEWQKSDQTLKDYLKEVLVEAGKVERFSAGLYRIL
jgi:AAA domain